VFSRTPIILFDDRRGRFGPLTDLRAVFELRTGAETILDRHRQQWGDRLVGVHVASGPTSGRVAELVAERVALAVNRLPDADRVILLNGRIALPDEFELPAANESLVARDDRDGERSASIVAVNLSRDQAVRVLDTGALSAGELPNEITRRAVETPLLSRPWQLLEIIDASIRHDLRAARHSAAVDAPSGTIVLRGEPILIDATARICPGVTIDSEHGPVIVRGGALVRPGAVLCGPCVVGESAVVAEHAVIRGRTVVGPRCKVGGEISATIFLGNSNKVHDGFLGDTIVGEWVNLGAGTIGSNLLNTYGETTMRLTPDDQRERTGRQFLGAIIGDHVKTAIGTRLMTATSIGLGAMIAASTPPPTTVAPFAWITDEGTRTYRLDKFLESMTRVMSRRHATPSPALIETITALHRSRT